LIQPRTLSDMSWLLTWAYAALVGVVPTPAHLAVGLAAATAVLLAVVLAAALAASTLPGAARTQGFPAAARRRPARSLPRLIDPDAAGRPRSRAPSAPLVAA
jgi:hypothetical protein